MPLCFAVIMKSYQAGPFTIVELAPDRITSLEGELSHEGLRRWYQEALPKYVGNGANLEIIAPNTEANYSVLLPQGALRGTVKVYHNLQEGLTSLRPSMGPEILGIIPKGMSGAVIYGNFLPDNQFRFLETELYQTVPCDQRHALEGLLNALCEDRKLSTMDLTEHKVGPMLHYQRLPLQARFRELKLSYLPDGATLTEEFFTWLKQNEQPVNKLAADALNVSRLLSLRQPSDEVMEGLSRLQEEVFCLEVPVNDRMDHLVPS
jgi:hypothetical protein